MEFKRAENERHPKQFTYNSDALEHTPHERSTVKFACTPGP